MNMTQQLKIQRLYDKAVKDGRANRGTEARITEQAEPVRRGRKPKVSRVPVEEEKTEA